MNVFLSPSRQVLQRGRMLGLLERLHDKPGEATTAYFRPGGDGAALEKMIMLAHRLESPPQGLAKAVGSSGTGGALFWAEDLGLLVTTHFPMTEEFVTEGIEVGPLKEMICQDRSVALLVVRLGEYGVGVFRGETLVSSKVGGGLVHSRHRQGGSSAHRFERHRDKQIEAFFTRVCEHTREQLEPCLHNLHHLVYGGERHTLLAFRARCEFLKVFESRTLDVVLDVRHPRQRALEEAIGRVLSVAVTAWQSAEGGPALTDGSWSH